MKASILEFWVAGCIVTKHDLGRSKHVGLRRFREHFGTTPNICEIVWNLLDDQELHPHGALPIHLLCALLFLKLYESEHINRSLTGFDEKTFRKWQWLYVDLMAHKLHMVSLDNKSEDLLSYLYRLFSLVTIVCVSNILTEDKIQ